MQITAIAATKPQHIGYTDGNKPAEVYLRAAAENGIPANICISVWVGDECSIYLFDTVEREAAFLASLPCYYIDDRASHISPSNMGQIADSHNREAQL